MYTAAMEGKKERKKANALDISGISVNCQKNPLQQIQFRTKKDEILLLCYFFFFVQRSTYHEAAAANRFFSKSRNS